MAFINRYLDIVATVGFGGTILVNPGATLIVDAPKDPSKTKNITKVLYDIVRCSLIHEADLPFNVQFTDDGFYGMRNGIYLIPTNFFYALLFSIVASPSMHGKSVMSEIQISLRGQLFPINEMIGNASAVRTFLNSDYRAVP